MTIAQNPNRTGAVLTRAINARGEDPRKVKRWANRMGAELRFRPTAPRVSAYTGKHRRQFLRTALRIVGRV